MARTRIKICGLRSADLARAAVDAGADAIGLVFAEGSPRHVTVDEARAVARSLPAYVEPVGLFVDLTAERVKQVAAAVGLRTVQLHGHEAPAYVRQLGGLRVTKALSFTEDAEAALEPWREARLSNLIGLMLDAPPPAEGALPGGSGRAFDWDALAALAQRGGLKSLPPLILAGGLTPENVGRAIATVRPYAVDVSSGVESSRGVKDAGKIAAFCAAVRQADSATG